MLSQDGLGEDKINTSGAKGDLQEFGSLWVSLESADSQGVLAGL